MSCVKSQLLGLSGLLFQNHRREPLLAFFKAFFDESGKFKDHKVISFCGLCSPSTRIAQLEDEWEGLLRHYQLPCLSMKRALRLKVRFSPTTKAETISERIEVLKPFADCIRKHTELGVTVALDVEGYAALTNAAKKKLGGSVDPHYFAVLCGLITPVAYIKPDDRIELVFDDDEKTAFNCYHLYRRVRIIDHRAHQRLIALTFAEDMEFKTLQAADFLSSLIRLEAHWQFRQRPYDYRALFNHLTAPAQPGGITWGISFYNRDKLVNETGPKLEKTRLGWSGN